jgi:hypothetical protein
VNGTMCFGGAHSKSWPRCLFAAAAVVWALGIAAGCHLPRMEPMAPQPGSVVTVAGDSVFAVSAETRHNADCCAAELRICEPVVQARSTSDLAVYAGVVAIAILVGSSSQRVSSPPRGPPRRGGLVIYETGRTILTRLCIARR